VDPGRQVAAGGALEQLGEPRRVGASTLRERL
jgi:hypothetical protein